MSSANNRRNRRMRKLQAQALENNDLPNYRNSLPSTVVALDNSYSIKPKKYPGNILSHEMPKQMEIRYFN